MREFAYTEHRHGLRKIAREKVERKRSPKNESYHLGQYGDTKKAGGNAGAVSWSDRGIGQPVRQYAYQELTYTAHDKAKEGKGKQFKKRYSRPRWP